MYLHANKKSNHKLAMHTSLVLIVHMHQNSSYHCNNYKLYFHLTIKRMLILPSIQWHQKQKNKIYQFQPHCVNLDCGCLIWFFLCMSCFEASFGLLISLSPSFPPFFVHKCCEHQQQEKSVLCFSFTPSRFLLVLWNVIKFLSPINKAKRTAFCAAQNFIWFDVHSFLLFLSCHLALNIWGFGPCQQLWQSMCLKGNLF